MLSVDLTRGIHLHITVWAKGWFGLREFDASDTVILDGNRRVDITPTATYAAILGACTDLDDATDVSPIVPLVAPPVGRVTPEDQTVDSILMESTESVLVLNAPGLQVTAPWTRRLCRQNVVCTHPESGGLVQITISILKIGRASCRER